MNIERERKFLVIKEKLPEVISVMVRQGEGHVIQAGYFTQQGTAVRITVKNHDRPGIKPVYKVGFKSPGTIERQEFEYNVPPEDALALLDHCPTYLKKERYEYDGWELDCIHINIAILGGKQVVHDLWIAEWEEEPGKRKMPNPLPAWIEREVTEDFSFTNQHLAWQFGQKRAPENRDSR